MVTQRSLADLRWRGRLPIPPHVHPIVRRLFEEMNRQSATIAEVSGRSGLGSPTISNWRSRTNPKIDLIDAALNALGLELCVQKRRAQ